MLALRSFTVNMFLEYTGAHTQIGHFPWVEDVVRLEVPHLQKPQVRCNVTLKTQQPHLGAKSKLVVVDELIYLCVVFFYKIRTHSNGILKSSFRIDQMTLDRRIVWFEPLEFCVVRFTQQVFGDCQKRLKKGNDKLPYFDQ